MFMKFESHSGVIYWFDNILGISFPINSSLETMVSSDASVRTIEINPENDMDAAYNARFMKKIEKARQYVYKYPKQKITPEQLKNQVLREGLLQLTLSITENCNLSCRYCCFSDIYPNTRNSSPRTMNFQTAKTALDYYASLLEEGKRVNPQRRPAIGFYGGEPLLNFKLIEKCVAYFEKTYPEFDTLYAITTNGTLLDKEKRVFLMAHDFSITVSIDGPEQEHDRNRIYRDGSGTFGDIMKNIKPLLDADYTKIHVICVFDWKSDLFALQDFFSREDVPRLSVIALPNTNDGCTFYERYSREDYKKFIVKDEEAFKSYTQHIKDSGNENSFFDHLFGLQAGKTLYSVPSLIDGTSFIVPYTFTCVPGRKIFVDVDGNYHICERINHTFPIGNIKTGLDFTKIAQIIEDYRSHLDQCPSCSVQKLCSICYCTFAADGQFRFATQACGNPVEDNKKALKRAFTLAEINPGLPESIADGYYTWLSEISATMED